MVFDIYLTKGIFVESEEGMEKGIKEAVNKMSKAGIEIDTYTTYT